VPILLLVWISATSLLTTLPSYIGDVVTVTITGDSPIGVILSAGKCFLDDYQFPFSAPDPEGYAAVIKSWARLPNGKFGPIQKVR
jgi:hypothetical protein